MITTLVPLLALAGSPLATAQTALVPAPSQATVAVFDHDYTALDGLLSRHVRDGAVDYRALRKQAGALERSLASFHAVTPNQLGAWTREQRFAFWINVYNATVLALIVEHYPIDSINALSTDELPIWKRPLIPMGAHHPAGTGQPLSLDVLEHELLRPRFRDARVHVAVNCAARSCPPLLPRALRASTLDRDLDAAMRAFLADADRNRFHADGDRVELSQIFEWFRSDFERDAGSLEAYLKRYAAGSSPRLDTAQITFLHYDWALNDIEPKAVASD